MANTTPTINDHWPVKILTVSLPDHQKINAQLLEHFQQYRAQHDKQQLGVYASPDDFANNNNNPAIATIKQFILDNVFAISKAANADYWQQIKQLDVDIIGMWFQISNQHAFHDVHVHGNCSWSGVYYVQSGSTSKSAKERNSNGMPNGITRFYGPNFEYQAGGHGDLGNFYLQYHTWDSYPEDGKLVIFPSHLKHMVFPYNGSDDRVIISFNAQVNGTQAKPYNYSFS